jgi:Mor family transcriptional regulator
LRVSKSFQKFVETITQTIGEKAAGQLIEAFPGRLLYISKGRIYDELCQAIGKKVSDVLVSKCRGLSVYIPNGKCLEAEERVRAIAEGYKGGDVQRYAREWGLSGVRIYQILRRFGIKTPGRNPGVEERHARIASEYNGGSIKEFARQQGYSPDGIRYILKKMGKYRVREV